MTAAVAAEPPKEMKLYVFTSGGLTLDKSIIQNGASGKVTIPVGFYLIRHPKGNVLFDTGNNDKIIKDPNYWGPFVQCPEAGQHAGRGDRRCSSEDRPQARRHQVCRPQPPPPRPWRQRRQVPELDDRRPARRDPERILAEGRDARSHHVGDVRAHPQQHDDRMPKRSRPSSSRATSICSATDSIVSTAPSRTRPAAR